jgi:hypothetical protein
VRKLLKPRKPLSIAVQRNRSSAPARFRRTEISHQNDAQ